MTKKYYKIVKQDTWSSAVSSSPTLEVEYELNQWVKPRLLGSDLFIFDTLENAIKCCWNSGWSEKDIFECEALGVRKRGIFISTWSDSFTKKIYKAVRARTNKKKYSHIVDNPIVGTLFARAVKLTRKLTDEEVSKAYKDFTGFDRSSRH